MHFSQRGATAKVLVGFDGSLDDDAIGKLAAFRANVQTAEEAQKRIAAATVRTREAAAAGNDLSKAMESAADLVALFAEHKIVCADMRMLARSILERCSFPTRDRRTRDGRALYTE